HAAPATLGAGAGSTVLPTLGYTAADGADPRQPQLFVLVDPRLADRDELRPPLRPDHGVARGRGGASGQAPPLADRPRPGAAGRRAAGVGLPRDLRVPRRTPPGQAALARRDRRPGRRAQPGGGDA